MISDWVMALFSGGGLTALTGIAWIFCKIIKYQGQFNHIDNKFQDIKDRISRLEKYFDVKINSKIKEADSPLSLTPYAVALLKEIGFAPLFDEIKDKLAKEIEKYHLRTKYDVQEMADLIVRRMKDDPIFDKLKGVVYERGQRWEEIIAAISIPLRDYYLSVHPEIKC
jgi:hypothetical protein